MLSDSKIKSGLELISIYGYPGLFLGLLIEFVGIAFPGEIVLTFTGFLIWSGHLNPFPAVASAILGSMSGTLIAYSLGRHFGRPFIDKYGKYVFMRKKTIRRAELLFNKHSIIVLLLGRFIPGVRPLSAYMAGIAHMKFWIFAPLSFVGVVIWCITFIIIGAKLRQQWSTVSGLLVKYNIILMSLLIIGILVIAGILLFKKLRAKRL